MSTDNSQTIAQLQQLIANMQAELASGRLPLRKFLSVQRELTDAQAYLASLTA
jgi:hypothetical protein